MEHSRRLQRSSKGKILGGVCAGLAAYFEIDPVLVRLVALFLALSDGLGIFLYILMWIIVPLEQSAAIPDRGQNLKQFAEGVSSGIQSAAARVQEGIGSDKSFGRAQDKAGKHHMVGIILVVFGLVLLLKMTIPLEFLRWGFLWSLGLIAVGVYLIMKDRAVKQRVHSPERKPHSAPFAENPKTPDETHVDKQV